MTNYFKAPASHWYWVIISLIFGLYGSSALAFPEGSWSFQASIFTTHYTKDPEHNNNQRLFALEYHGESDWLYGGATFRNSFDQRSNYLYVGRVFDHDSSPLYAKVTGGLIHGYRGEYRDKIPLNQLGIAPAIVPSIGLQYDMVSTEVVVFGAAGLMINMGFHF